MSSTGANGSSDSRERRSSRHDWTRYLFYRKWSIKTTWALRLALIVSALLVLVSTRGLWIPSIGRALVCEQQNGPSDAILVDNFEVNYLLFERAAELRRLHASVRVLVPTEASSDPNEPNIVSAGIVEVMARVAQLRQPELIPIREVEPISLNAAYQIRDVLQKEQLRSVVVVSPAFRSRRSALVYGVVFADAGIATYCEPVFGLQTADTWSHTWHGIQQVTEQYLKLQYYRFYVLPRLPEGSRSTAKAGE